MNTPLPKRSWFRFSLRTLLIATTLLAAFLGWFTVRIREANAQREAVATIQKRGDSVTYDRQAWTVGVGERCPEWLRNRLGSDFFQRVVSATIHDDWVDVEVFAACPRLTELRYFPTGVTDAVPSRLKGLQQIEVLYLPDTKITDAGLAHLAELPRLRTLEVGGDQITDAGLVHLKGLPRLERLALGGKITDAGLEHLAELKQLRWLDVRVGPITVAGLKKLQQELPNCEISPLSTNVRAPPKPAEGTN